MECTGIGNLAQALATAQSEFRNPERNRTVEVQTRTGGKYSFQYATLDSILEMIRIPLAKNSLALTHSVTARDNGGWNCVTRLLHASGEWIDCAVPLVYHHDENAQAFGSALTYAKRYGVCALLAITADDDDDGNAACGNTVSKQADKAPRKTAQKFTSPPPKEPAKTPEKTEPNPEKKFSWSTATAQERVDFLAQRIGFYRAATDEATGKPLPKTERIKKLNEVMAYAVNHEKDIEGVDNTVLTTLFTEAIAAIDSEQK